MSLRRTVSAQRDGKVTFSDFSSTPPPNFGSRRHFPEVPSHWHFNRRRPEHGRTVYCYLFFVGSSNNFFLALAVKKYRFWGENHFFSPPCVTPLGSVCQFWSSTRPDLPGKKNRRSIGRRLRVLDTHESTIFDI